MKKLQGLLRRGNIWWFRRKICWDYFSVPLAFSSGTSDMTIATKWALEMHKFCEGLKMSNTLWDDHLVRTITPEQRATVIREEARLHSQKLLAQFLENAPTEKQRDFFPRRNSVLAMMCQEAAEGRPDHESWEKFWEMALQSGLVANDAKRLDKSNDIHRKLSVFLQTVDAELELIARYLGVSPDAHHKNIIRLALYKGREIGTKEATSALADGSYLDPDRDYRRPAWSLQRQMEEGDIGQHWADPVPTYYAPQPTGTETKATTASHREELDTAKPHFLDTMVDVMEATCSDKRADPTGQEIGWDDKTCRQAMQTARLFELIVGTFPVTELTQDHLLHFSNVLDS